MEILKIKRTFACLFCSKMKLCNQKQLDAAQDCLTARLNAQGFRKTPERYAILKAIYTEQNHVDIDCLCDKLKKEKYAVSKATVYNTVELLENFGLVKKHHFRNQKAVYEPNYTELRHSHICMLDSGDVYEFIDHQLEEIRKKIEEKYNVNIEDHSLIFYARKKQK